MPLQPKEPPRDKFFETYHYTGTTDSQDQNSDSEDDDEVDRKLKVQKLDPSPLPQSQSQASTSTSRQNGQNLSPQSQLPQPTPSPSSTSSVLKKKPPKPTLSKIEQAKVDKNNKHLKWLKLAGMKVGSLDKWICKRENSENGGHAEPAAPVNRNPDTPARRNPVVFDYSCLNRSKKRGKQMDKNPKKKVKSTPQKLERQEQELQNPVPGTSKAAGPAAGAAPIQLASTSSPITQQPKSTKPKSRTGGAGAGASKPKTPAPITITPKKLFPTVKPRLSGSNTPVQAPKGLKQSVVGRKLLFDDEEEDEPIQEEEAKTLIVDPSGAETGVLDPPAPVQTPPQVGTSTSSKFQDLPTVKINPRNFSRSLSLTSESNSSCVAEEQEVGNVVPEREPQPSTSRRGKSTTGTKRRVKIYSWEPQAELEPLPKKLKTDSGEPIPAVQTTANFLEPTIHSDVIFHAVLETESISSSHRRKGISGMIQALEQADPGKDFHRILDGIQLASAKLVAMEDSDSQPLPSSSESNCYFALISRILQKTETRSELQSQNKLANAYLTALFNYIQKNYDTWSDLEVKLHFPIIATLFQGPEEGRKHWSQNVKNNFKELVEYFLRNGGDKIGKNFEIANKFSTLGLSHYFKYDNDTCKNIYITWIELKTLFLETIKDDHKSALPMISSLQNLQFGIELTEKMLESLFCSEFGNRPGREIKDCLIKLFNYLSSQLWTEDETLAAAVPVTGATEQEQEAKIPAAGSKKTTKGLDKDKYGNSELHKLCGKLRKSSDDEETLGKLAFKLDELNSGNGNINVPDNFGNTPLHDAVSYGRVKAVQLLIEKCWDPKKIDDPKNLNLSAQSDTGNTPLHEAILQLIDLEEPEGSAPSVSRIRSRGNHDPAQYYVRFDIFMHLTQTLIQSPTEFLKIFRLKNSNGQTPFGLCLPKQGDSIESSNYQIRNQLLLCLNEIFPESLNPERKFGKIVFKPESIDRIWTDETVQGLIKIWKDFYVRRFVRPDY